MNAMGMRITVILIAISAVPLAANTAYAAPCASVQSQPSLGDAQKCARIALAQEFVRELEILYRLQETAKRELAEDNSASGSLMTSIRFGSRTLFEMNDSINRLRTINVDGRWAEFRGMLEQLHQQRIEIVAEMTKTSKTLLAGPEPGINYGKLVARAPELTTQMEQTDKTFFTMAQAMFFALVDDTRVGADGNLHHLLLTKKDRTRMVQLIDKMFGPTLEDKNASSIVSSAWVIKYGLTRPNYKAADEPVELCTHAMSIRCLGKACAMNLESIVARRWERPFRSGVEKMGEGQDRARVGGSTL